MHNTLWELLQGEVRFGGLWHQQCNVEENVLEQKNMSGSLAQTTHFLRQCVHSLDSKVFLIQMLL